ncbi:hypothetical protein Tco_1511851 [Tanacetum coccineum]
MTESPLVESGLAVSVFFPGDDPITCLNKAIAFLTVVASSRFPSTNNQLRTSLNPRNQATIQHGKVIVQQAWVVKYDNYQGEGHMARQCTQPKQPRNAIQEAGQILDEEQLAFLAYLGFPDGQVTQSIIPNNVLMANISNYGSDIMLEVPHSETYLNDMENQSVHAMHDFEQTPVVDVTDNEITSDSNIILYS